MGCHELGGSTIPNEVTANLAAKNGVHGAVFADRPSPVEPYFIQKALRRPSSKKGTSDIARAPSG